MNKHSHDRMSFVQIETVHMGEVAWWWRDEKLHDSDYHIKVADSVDAKVKELVRKYDVSDDTRYCSQWEGRKLVGSDRQQVAAAAQELAQHVARFKGLASLDELSGASAIPA